jgi:hypothetical protein
VLGAVVRAFSRPQRVAPIGRLASAAGGAALDASLAYGPRGMAASYDTHMDRAA